MSIPDRPERKAIIIGLVGYAGSGKDTVGRKLMMSHGFERLSFADVLKRVAYGANPDIYAPREEDSPTLGAVIPLRQLVDSRGWEEAKKIDGVRGFLQRLGTDGVRAHLGEDVWVNPVRKQIVDNLQTGRSTVITDVRFPNEAKLVIDMGGYIVRVGRPGVNPSNGHVSETSLDDVAVDYLLTNDSTVQELGKQVNGTVRHIEHQRGVKSRVPDVIATCDEPSCDCGDLVV